MIKPAAKLNDGGAFIANVSTGSIAEEIGLASGDCLIKINGEIPRDIICYQLLAYSENIELEIIKENGEPWFIEIEKENGEPLGISFTPTTIDKVLTCENNCIFCFVSQNPEGMRSTVKFKDDDYRLSFLEGNYITLNNLSDKDFSNIISHKISPLYVSVHTTNFDLRSRMMINPKAGLIMEKLKDLTRNGIHVHGQIVVCPGWNDGKELLRSITELSSLGPAMETLAVVPVGLTAYRENLTSLSPLVKEDALKTLNELHSFQKKMLRERGSRFVFPSDEYYIVAEEPVPSEEAYEDYPQLSNGVGLLRLFLEEYDEWIGLKDAHPQPEKPLKITLATSEAAKDYLSLVADFYNKISNLQINLEIIPSRFFGGHVTVAGLLTGKDFIEALAGKDTGNVVFFPGIAVKEDESIFLDGISVAEVSSEIGNIFKPVYSLRELSEQIVTLQNKGVGC